MGMSYAHYPLADQTLSRRCWRHMRWFPGDGASVGRGAFCLEIAAFNAMFRPLCQRLRMCSIEVSVGAGIWWPFRAWPCIRSCMHSHLHAYIATRIVIGRLTRRFLLHELVYHAFMRTHWSSLFNTNRSNSKGLFVMSWQCVRARRVEFRSHVSLRMSS